MSIWGTTSDWAGDGRHVKRTLDRDECCPGEPMGRVNGRGGDMEMTDRDDGALLEVWQCRGCLSVWFRRAGMNRFFSVKPAPSDPFRR